MTKSIDSIAAATAQSAASRPRDAARRALLDAAERLLIDVGHAGILQRPVERVNLGEPFAVSGNQGDGLRWLPHGATYSTRRGGLLCMLLPVCGPITTR